MTDSTKAKSAKMWGGRFQAPPAPEFERFNASFPFDYRLLPADIEVNLAWAAALNHAGVLTDQECRDLREALQAIRREWSDRIPDLSSAEDVHSFVESQLVARVGELGQKIHTGRSRNDQVATDIRLYMKRHIGWQKRQLADVAVELLRLAGEHIGVPMAGYTHLQRAQPLLFAHYLLSFEAMLDRDYRRLAAAFEAADEMPLGSGALAGTAFRIDRDALARTLGFSEVSRNSIDAVSNRDFLCDYLYAGSLLLGHLSRLAADFILYSSAEFALLRMGDSVTTGSSLMPQKRNPDALELLRGKASAMEARLLSLLGLLHGLPSSYNKDLQEDKVPVFAAIEELELALPVMGLVLKDLSIDEPRMRQVAADSFLLATDMADYLVEKGVPFRSAHRVVGELVHLAVTRNQALTDLSLEELRRHDEHFDDDFQAAFTVQRSLERRCAFGGTAPVRVSEQLDAASDRWSARLIS